MQNRIRQVQQAVRDQGWDAFWVSSPANRRYLTGFTGSAGWVLIPARGKSVLITDGRYKEQAHDESRGITVVICQQDSIHSLAQQLQNHHVRQLGLEDDQITLAVWDRLRRQTQAISRRKGSGLVEKIRAIKTADEIRCCRKAIRMAEQAYQRTLPALRPGASEIEVARRLENAMADAGAEGIAFPTIVASGPRSSLPHAQPSNRRLKAGELVVLDFGCIYKGYHSDLTRTVAIAKMTAKQQEFYKTVKKAQKEAQKTMISGKLSADSDQKARDVLRNARLEKYFIHSLGHGLGLEIHEGPRLAPGSKDRLAAGMLVTCEPGIYLPGWGGIRIEDDVLVGETASQWLSHSSETLPVIKHR